jgi:hypothetical protein
LHTLLDNFILSFSSTHTSTLHRLLTNLTLLRSLDAGLSQRSLQKKASRTLLGRTEAGNVRSLRNGLSSSGVRVQPHDGRTDGRGNPLILPMSSLPCFAASCQNWPWAQIAEATVEFSNLNCAALCLDLDLQREQIELKEADGLLGDWAVSGIK